MQITFAGKTRIVLIFKRRVIKFARIRFLRVPGHLVRLLISPEFRVRFYERYGATFCAALWKDLFLGFYANRSEASVDWHDRRVAPTLASFFFGFINIQQRGRPVTEEELKNACPFDREKFSGQVRIEAYDPHQYCKITGRGVVLADYGEPAVREMLRA